MQGYNFTTLRVAAALPKSVVSFPAFLLATSILAASPLLAQSVVSDGGTATTVNLSPTGQITVGIAPASAASISHNTYSDFSVPASGVRLDNSIVAAGTILNEVTSAKITTIEGELSVIGQEADVIVANPNGIAVNGGRFLNTRNVALTTGVPGRDASDRVITTVRAGDITIGSGGLSGTMEELALISKSLRVGGPVTFDTIDGTSHLNIVTGDSVVSFDPGRGGGGFLPWALATDRGSASSSTILVDITGQGSLSSGRISVLVTDAGAGVRIAGDQMASAGGFRLSSAGKIELSEARIDATGSVNIKGSSLELTSTDTRGAEITSLESGVVLDLNDGDLDIGSAKISGAKIASDNLASSGGVTLLVDGRITTETSSGGEMAELSSSESHVVLTAGNGIVLDGLLADTFGDFRLASNGAIAFSDVTGAIGEDFRVLTSASLSFDQSILTANSDIRLDAGDLAVGASDPDQSRTELLAENGGFVAKTSVGGILNYGSLLQGRVATAGDVESLGGMTLLSARDILNESLSVDRLAVAFGEADNLYVSANGDVLNKTGRLFSNAAISISTTGDLLNETAFTGATNPYTINRYKGGRFASSLFLKRSRKTSITADFGEQAIAGEQSFILGVGDVSLRAENIQSIGADITGAKVDILANQAFSNESRQVGRLNFSQSCKLFCKTSGSSTLRTLGGSVTGSDSVDITAGEEVSIVAGRVDGATGVSITAPLTRFIPILTAAFIDQRTGSSGFFGSRAGYLVREFKFGTVRVPAGAITFNGDVDLGGVNIFSGEELVITGTRIESEAPAEQEVIGRQPIGLFWSIF